MIPLKGANCFTKPCRRCKGKFKPSGRYSEVCDKCKRKAIVGGRQNNKSTRRIAELLKKLPKSYRKGLLSK